MNKKPKGVVKDAKIDFRCTRKEKENLIARAKKEHLGIGEYLIKMCKNPGGDLKGLMPDILKQIDLMNELHGLIKDSNDRELKKKCERLLQQWEEENINA